MDELAEEAPRRTLWSRVTGFVDALWATPLGFFESVGGHVLLLVQVIGWFFRPRFRIGLMLEAMEFVGTGSLVIVTLVSLFVGMVFSLQLVSAFRQFQADAFVGSTLALALSRELAPVFTSIVIAARAGSGMATELGSMRITEQIDALDTFAVNPVQYLVMPRVVAATIMVPLLTMVFNMVGMIGGWLVAVLLQNVDHGVFLENTRWFLDGNDIAQGLAKACVFGLALSLISCYQGFYASGGAKGVGVATTRAVVASFVTILVADYFLTDLWLALLPKGGQPLSRRDVDAPDVHQGDALDAYRQRDERYAIRIRDLSRRFGTHHVLRGVDLDVERGRINIVIGGSGQGKSVLLKHIIGLVRPDEGHIFIDGVDTVGMRDIDLHRVRAKLGLVFQYSALFDSMTVEENIAFPLREHTKLKSAEIRAEVLRAFDSLHLPRVLLAKYPAEISGGQRKRVGLARALVRKPEILLYDEPTTGLDPIATKNVDDMIRDIAQQLGVTSLVISHDMASTFRIGDRISMLHEGRIIASGPRDEILRSADPTLRAFVETSGAVTMLTPTPLPPASETAPAQAGA